MKMTGSEKISLMEQTKMHVTSFFNNPRLLHHKIPGALPHLVLKFEGVLLLPGPDQFFKFHIRFL